MNFGTVISHAPNIDDASTSISTANPISTAGFCSHDPNIFPLSAATTPSAEYMMTRPRTYEAERAKRRERRPSLCIAKNPTVIGIIGNTHGVRFSASPPTKRISSVKGSPCARNALVSRSCGAAESGVKVICVGTGCVGTGFSRSVRPAEAGPTLISFETFFGGRQTVSLHAW